MRPTFHIVDYIVFAVTIVASLGIGVYFAFAGKKQEDNKEYLMGGRNMKLIPVAISLIVSFLSTISILGNPAEVYMFGTQYMWYLVALIGGVVYGTMMFVPLYYPLQLTSIFEYTRMRFNTKPVEYFAISLAMFTMVVLNGIMLYSPCVAFEGVSGFPSWASIIITGVTATVYTSLGGMKAVVWTDVFQAFFIIAGLVAIVIKGTLAVGSISEVWRINQEWNRVKFLDFRFDPTIRLTFWSVCVMNSIMWMCMVGTQPSVQRFVSLPSMKKAKITTLILIPGFLISGLLTCSCGVTAFAYYAKKGCDPFMSGMIKSPNQILPFFVMDVLNVPSIPGLFVASLFSASLSSLSSTYSAMAAIMWQNILTGKYGHLPSKKQANITKICTSVFGMFSIVMAFAVMGFGGTLIQMTYSVIGAIAGPLIGMTLVGAMIPQVGGKSIFVATLVALLLSIWIGIGSVFYGTHDHPLPAPTYNCSWPQLPMDPNITSSLTTPWPDPPLNGSVDQISGVDVSQSDMTPLLVPVASHVTGVRKMYTLSYFYYPFVGIVTVFVLCILSLIIPSCRHVGDVPKKLLFPCVRRWCGVPDSKVDSLQTKEDLIEIKHIYASSDGPDTKEPEDVSETHPMICTPPGVSDVWQPRDDMKRRPLKRSGDIEVTTPLMTTPHVTNPLTHQDFY